MKLYYSNTNNNNNKITKKVLLNAHIIISCVNKNHHQSQQKHKHTHTHTNKETDRQSDKLLLPIEFQFNCGNYAFTLFMFEYK